MLRLLFCVALLAGCAPPPAASDGWQSLIPLPTEQTTGEDTWSLEPASVITVSPEGQGLEDIAERLATVLRRSTGFALPVKANAPGGAIQLTLDTTISTLGNEGYTLEVGPGGLEIRSATAAGLFYGTQTVRQLLPARIEQSSPQAGPWSVASGTIRDVPRYTWRGFMVDVARHFFTLDDLRREVDVMAHYKMNRLHLHLTDDQGWRLQLDARPALTDIGGATQVGGGPGGFLSKADYADLVQYAAARFVTVVPEIDLPGHTHAALSSLPELNCDGVAPAPYTGTEVGLSSLCFTQAATDTFLQEVIAEVASITPGAWLHIGGDEARMTSDADYRALVSRAADLVHAQGKLVMGWEDIAKAGVGDVVQEWLDPSVAAKAVSLGGLVVLSPAKRAYLDMQYALDVPSGVGTFWAGFVSVPVAYDWDPGTFSADLPESSLLGVEAPVWTETIATVSQLDAMVFPRLLGFAELGWSPHNERGVREYLQRLAAHGPRLTAWGIGYYAAPQVSWAQ